MLHSNIPLSRNAFLINHRQNRRDMFNVKLRKLVKNTIETSNQNIESSIPGLDHFLNAKNNTRIYKILWLIFFTVSSVMLAYQTFDRIDYYFSYPVAVDVLDDDMDYFVPPIMICNPNTNLMKPIWQKFPHDMVEGVTTSCVNQVLSLFDIPESNLTIEELWKLSNISANMVELDTKEMGKITLQFNHDFTIHGICVTFHVDEPISVVEGKSFSVSYEHPGICLESGFTIYFVRYMKGQLDVLRSTSRMPKSDSTLFYLFNKYVFVNSPKNPCVEQDVYDQCHYDCIFQLKKNQLKCGFPSTDKRLGLRICNMSDKLRDQYVVEMKMMREIDPRIACGCIRPCEDRVVERSADVIQSENDHTRFKFVYRKEKIRTTHERLSYDEISLLSDLGGNLGLALGLSVLTLIETSFYLKSKFFTSCTITRRPRNRLEKKVVKIFEKVKQADGNATPKRYTAIIVVKITLLLFTSVVTIYCLYARIEFYLSEPIVTIIEIMKQEQVQLPTITVCGETARIGMNRNKLFKTLGTHECTTVPAWTLVTPTFKIEQVWQESSIDKFLDTVDQKKHHSGYEIKVNISHYFLATPFGNCSQIASEPVKFMGVLGSIMITLKEMAIVKKCQNKNLWHFSTNPGERVNIAEPYSVPYGYHSELNYNIIKIQRKNTRRQSCEKEYNKYRDCKNNCLPQKAVLSGLSCKLPYMNESEITQCTSSGDALKAHFKYIENYMKMIRTCDCKKPCEETLNRFNIVSDMMFVDQYTLISHYFATNIIESLIENDAYPLTKLVGDAGSIIGLGVGLSILSFYDFTLALISFKQKYSEKKP